MQFIDRDGLPLPLRQGVPYVPQYGKRWRVRMPQGFQGTLIADAKDNIALRCLGDGLWEIPDGSRLNAVGKLLIVAMNEQGTRVHLGVVEIEPTNIDDHEYTTMLREIGLLALSCYSDAAREVWLDLADVVGQESMVGVPKPRMVRADSLKDLEDLVRAAQRAVNQIKVQPLRSLAMVNGPSPTRGICSSPRKALSVRLRPERPQVLGASRQESLQCPENAFVAYVVKHIVQSYCRSLLNLFQIWGSEPALYEDGSLTRLPPSNRLEERVQRLERILSWSKRASRELQALGINSPKALPATTTRLLGTPGYSLLAVSVAKMRREVDFEGLEWALAIDGAIQEGRVKPARDMYEQWCILRLHALFAVRFNLRPDRHRSLRARLKIENGTLVLARDHPFALTGQVGGAELGVTFCYEPLLARHDGSRHAYKPDITISLSHARFNGRDRLFVFDAKYKQYARLDSEELAKDLVQQVLTKYLKGLRKAPEAAFILTTDSTVEYWGDRPIGNDFRLVDVSPRGGGAIENVLAKPGHRFGCVEFRPATAKGKGAIELFITSEKLLTLMMHFFSPFAEICPRCGTRQESVYEVGYFKKGSTSENRRAFEVVGAHEPPAPFDCLCPECGRWWEVWWCRTCPGQSRLVKLHEASRANLHYPSKRVDSQVRVHCPRCFSDT